MKTQLFRQIALLIGLALFPAMASAETKYATVDQAVLNYSALQPRQQAVAAVVVTIKEGFHAQSHHPSDPAYIPLEASVDENPAFKVYPVVYPPGEDHTYANIDASKPLNVYTGQVIIYVPLEVKADAPVGPLTINGVIHLQACDNNVCYPPAKLKFSIDTKVVGADQPVTQQNVDLFKNLDYRMLFNQGGAGGTGASQASAAPTRATTTFAGFELKNNSYLLAFIAAFFAGVIFNAVPCVLPVLPLKAIGFYEVSQHDRARCIAYGAVFSLGLVAVFGVLALFIVVKKAIGWGEIYSNVYFNLGIVIILLVMAVGTFGAFTVNLPTAVYNFTPRHDTYFGNFLFGVLTAILSTPCTFGLFLGVLVWATAQPWFIGVPLVMTVGVGMASPYFVLSAFPELARKFPRTGPWSELVKQVMAFLLLGSAVFFARRFIQPITGADPFWWVLFAVAVMAALFLVVRTLAISKNFVPRAVVFAIAAGVVLGSFLVVRSIVNQPYEWMAYSPQALESARKSGKVVVVDFTATWCSTCQYLESSTLHSPEVVSTVKQRNVQMFKADLTSETAPGWALLQEVSRLKAIPYTVVYGPGTDHPQQLEGIYSPAVLKTAIERAAGRPGFSLIEQ